MSEKKREPNFTVDEKLHLFNIVTTYANIIEDKKTDRASSAEKSRTWLEIGKLFNSSSPNTYYRKVEALKLLYENKKKELRKKLAEDKKQRFLTGGGPMPISKLDPIDEILISILNEKSIHGLKNPYDSNGLISSATESATIIQSIVSNQELVFELNQGEAEATTENDAVLLSDIDTNLNATQLEKKRPIIDSIIENVAAPSNDSKRDWKKYKPADLQSPLTTTLRPTRQEVHIQGFPTKVPGVQSQAIPAPPNASKRRPTRSVKTLTSSDVATKYNMLLDKRLVLVQKQIEAIDEEHEFVRKERQLKLQLLQSKIISQHALVPGPK